MTGDQDVLARWAPLFCLCLFSGMLLLHDLGRYLGDRRRAKDVEGARLGLGPVESATFGLLGCSSPSRSLALPHASTRGAIW